MTETIVAQATPQGESALALIRISGDLSDKIIKDACNLDSPTPRNAYCKNYSLINGNIIDQIIVIYYKKNNSFTSEKSIEIACHGNQLIVETIVNDLIERGCRVATPGEFTLKSFLNGNIDLTQAEAIAELINAKNETALKLANRNLKGNLSREIIHIQNTCIKQHARIEAFIDFPEDDLGKEQTEELTLELVDVREKISGLLRVSNSTHEFNKLTKVILIGPPNAGKSSIFNAIVGQERSIIDKVAGTTRDYIDYDLKLKRYRVKLFDTAGLRSTNTNVEKEGINRTLSLLDEADLILLVLDSANPYPTDIDNYIKKWVNNNKSIVLLNKSDLSRNIDLNDTLISKLEKIATSIKKENSIECLIEKIEEFLDSKLKETENQNYYVNLRHTTALNNALENLNNAIIKIANGTQLEFSVPDLKMVIDDLGTIVGSTDNENMLDELFSSFCIGK